MYKEVSFDGSTVNTDSNVKQFKLKNILTAFQFMKEEQKQVLGCVSINSRVLRAPLFLVCISNSLIVAVTTAIIKALLTFAITEGIFGFSFLFFGVINIILGVFTIKLYNVA